MRTSSGTDKNFEFIKISSFLFRSLASTSCSACQVNHEVNIDTEKADSLEKERKKQIKVH